MLEPVQELCRSSYGVPASLHESHGCAWHLNDGDAGRGVLELVPLGWMFDAIVSDYDLISKIQARQSVRNRELYTGQWADTRSSRVREQQVVDQKPRRVNRVPHRRGTHYADGLDALRLYYLEPTL